MPLFRRKPRITDEIYGRLMTSFGRVGPVDPFIWGPSKALAERVAAENPALVSELDAQTYAGSTEYHLQLLASAWLLAADEQVPEETAEIFAEAVSWKLKPLAKNAGVLPSRLTELARGEMQRDASMDTH